MKKGVSITFDTPLFIYGHLFSIFCYYSTTIGLYLGTKVFMITHPTR